MDSLALPIVDSVQLEAYSCTHFISKGVLLCCPQNEQVLKLTLGTNFVKKQFKLSKIAKFANAMELSGLLLFT